MSATTARAEPVAPARPDPVHGRRPAPDGLRAVAVLAVAVYHFGGGDTSWLRGGFLGVDVFFVLSGYLITGLLLTEHARTGTVRLGQFWLRRVRRLLPALLLVLLAVSAWTWWAGIPDAYPRRRTDLWWTVAYLANWHAVDVAEDYFAAYVGASPLRHAWSLAVEEQFYLLWPVLLLGLLAAARRWRRLRALVPVTIAAAIPVSALLMAAEYVPGDPTRAYYGTEGRVQQLMLGALLAWALPRLPRLLPGRWAAGSWAAVGLAVLLAGFAVMDDVAAPYYRGGALAAGLAAAALLAGIELAPRSAVARLLSTPVLVGLGRISYGVYLWHWPVTVAVPVAGLPLSEQALRQGLRVLVTLVAAIVSYLLVERPVQQGRWWRPARRLLPVAAVATAAVLAAGVQATALPAGVAQQLAASSDHPCPGEQPDLLTACVRPLGQAAPPSASTSSPRPSSAGASARLVIAGDSIARSLQPGIDSWARARGVSWVEAAWKQCTASGLQLLPPGDTVPERIAVICHAQAATLLDRTVAAHPGATVLVSELSPSIRAIQDPSGAVHNPGTPGHLAALEAGYLRLVDRVAATGGRVVFVELPPAGRSLGTVVARGRPAANARAAPVQGTEERVNQAFRTAVRLRPTTAAVVSVTDLVCPGGVCRPLLDGRLVRTDGVHYARGFADRLVPELLARVDRAFPAGQPVRPGGQQPEG
jgi:peptidoglycan/LPS O-acetylase OafA/YrhL